MFGLSFGELLMVLLVGVVVLGPKELPRYLRKAGQLAGQLRRMAYDMRAKSGIDEMLRTEGIDQDIAEIRKLARGEMADVMAAVRSTADAARFKDVPASPYAPADPVVPPMPSRVEHEYPIEGADSYGALPDTANVYDSQFPASALANDALYARGGLPPLQPPLAAPPPEPASHPRASQAEPASSDPRDPHPDPSPR
jgi:sec-independent protein translocase protein TatB